MQFLDVLKVILFGIVEGITEWLPVSSTGHLILFDAFLPLPFSAAFMDMFEYVIQLAAIFAVIILFWNKIFPLKKTTDENGKNGLQWKKDSLALWARVLVACIPALLALVIDKLLLDNLDEFLQTTLIACTLIVYGVIFIVVEDMNKNKNPKITQTAELSIKTAFLIGCFQVLAVIPGTSRSGITIIGALLMSVSRETAAEFTFLLSIPTMVGSSAYKILGFFLDGGVLGGTEWLALIIGCAVAFTVSLFAIKFLMNFVKSHNFKPFGYYRIALGIIVLATLVVPVVLA